MLRKTQGLLILGTQDCFGLVCFLVWIRIIILQTAGWVRKLPCRYINLK